MIEFKLVGYVDGKEMASLNIASNSSQQMSEIVEHTANHGELTDKLIKVFAKQFDDEGFKHKLGTVVRIVLFKASLGGTRAKT